MAKVAVAQFTASIDKADNLGRVTEYIEEAAWGGADLCAFPEFMMAYTPSTQDGEKLAADAETISGPFVSEVCRAAGLHHIDVVGTFYEKGPRGNHVYDTAFLVDRSGTIRATYRKIHLYDALGFCESDKLEAGDFITSPVQTGIGIAGMMICYDLRFPEMARTLAGAGAQILVAPSAWVAGDKKIEHWNIMNRARAMENGCFLVAPAHTGNIYCGRSLVVDPFGEVLLEMDEDEGIGYAEVDLDVVQQTRQKLPLLAGRRLDIYPNMAGSLR